MSWLKEFHYRIYEFCPVPLFYFLFFFVNVLVISIICIDDVGGCKGQHTCYITTVEDANNLTWDSVLVWTKTDTAASNEDVFCVSDNDVRKKLEVAARNKKLVTLKYKNDFILWRWECNGGTSIIVDIEEE